MHKYSPRTVHPGFAARNYRSGSSGKNFAAGKFRACCLALIALLVSFQVNAQQTVVIGATTGTGSTYFGPVYNFGGSSTTDNSRHAYLYTAAELGIPTGAVITEIAWLKADAGAVTGNNTFNLLLNNTAATALTAGTTWGTLTTGATTVYASTTQAISGAANTYLAFPVSNFVYTGGNLQIMTDWERETNPGAAVTFYPNAAAGKAIGTASTATLTNTTTLNTTTYGNSRPTIRISYASGRDLGITGITLGSAPVPPGTPQTITATIKNFGTCPITNFPITRTINGGAPVTETFTGVLAPQATVPYTFASTGNFIAGTNTITVSLPLGSGPGPCDTDIDPTNNSFTLRIATCTHTAPLNGTYTIDKNFPNSSTNFQSFTAAADALNGCGVSGPVIFNVVVVGSAPYIEQVSLMNIPGASATNTITFNGNGNTLRATPTAANPAIIKFDNADYVRFNNLNITVDPAATVGWGVQLINGSDFATISGCTITVPLTTGSNLNGIVAGTAPNTVGNNTNNSSFENNTIIGGASGINLNGTTTNPAMNNRITGNTFRDCDTYFIFLNNVDGTLVEANDISRPTRTTTANFQGIYMQGAANRNNIFNRNRIHTTGALATAAYGINFRNGSAPAGSENLVKNNIIYNFQNTGNTYGIVNVGNGGVNYYHNTIYFSKTTLTGSAVVQGIHQNDAAQNINFLNNIIVIDVPGTSTNLKHALYFNQPASGISSNRNVLFITPATNNGHLGYYSGASHTTLANWQTVNSSAFDQNSLSINPGFVNPATGDLTPTNATVNNSGRPVVPAVADDFTGLITRNVATPDPGAFEFNLNVTPLSGSYTINKAAATGGTNFQSFGDATQALTNAGISSAVTFNVVPGSGPYNEKVEILAVTGASATNTVTFNGNGNVVTTTTITDGAVIVLDGAKYIRLDSLTINVVPASTTVGGIGIQLINGADHNVVNRSTINLPLTSTNGNLLGILASNGLTTRGNHTNYSVFSNNTINGGYYGIRINGATGGLTAVGNQIINNRIRDTYFYNINLNDADGTLVSGNEISRPTRAGVPTFYGIYIGLTTVNSMIRNNKIHNTNGGTTAYGIYSTAADAPVGSENVFYNNVIYNFSNSGITYAIYNSGSDGHYYFHNTIDLNNSSNTGTVRAFYQLTAATNIRFQNNIVTLNAGATGTKHALYFGTTTSSIISNNNVLYVSPTATNHHIGYYSTNQTTLAAWKTVNNAAYDQNSMSADPMYTNPATGDFTPTNAAINGIGAPLAAVPLDILGRPRSTSAPDPGAWEFMNNAIDVGVIAISAPNSGCGLTASETVTITIQNFGTSPQSNIALTFKVNGIIVGTGTFAGVLAPGATATFTFTTTANLSAPGSYTIEACTMVSGDMVPANDCSTRVVTNSMTAGLPDLDFETPATGLAAMQAVTRSRSAVYEHAGASNGQGSTKGLILDGVNSASWVIPTGVTDPWNSNPEHFAAAYICFSPAGGNPNDPLWLSFDLKQLFKTANANTNLRVTVNGTPVGGNQTNPANTYRPPFDPNNPATPIVWTPVHIDLTAYKNLPSIQIGFESSVKEEFANGTGTANLIDNVRLLRFNPLSLKDDLLQSQMHVFPNPSNGTFQVDLPQGKTYELTVTDLTGREISRQTVKTPTTQIDLKAAVKGIYLLKITSEGNTAIKKLVVQ